MSINFDPNQKTSTNQKPSEKPNPLVQLFQRYMELQYEGYLKEKLPPEEFCARKWVQETGTSSSKITPEFMQACSKDCEYFKTYCRWSRLN